LVRQFGNRIQFIGMAGRDTPAAMQEFVDRYGLGSIPHTVSQDAGLWSEFSVAYQPAWLFIDDSGRADLYPGAIPEEDLEGLLRDLETT
jgi:hypothetical protein